MKNNNLELRFDLFGFISLFLTFISLLFAFGLSLEFMILSLGVFLLTIASYLFLSIKTLINIQGKEIKKTNEKINIYKDIYDLKAKVDLLFNMKKRGNIDLTEILMRLIQIGAIVFAAYIILKSLGILQ
ncbi:hypothetical protein CMI42_00285 [Candidatus Pacearchaeota archaeon]|nr:hypothetical protein [Candidatus Pacearchaeota archaeon]